MRALKSYMQFIRISASDRSSFDEDFMEGQHNIHKLFRHATRRANGLNATLLQQLSHSFDAQHPDVPLVSNESHARLRENPSSVFSRRFTLRLAVDRAIRTRIGEKLARFHAMTWIFGVPVPDICHESSLGS